MLGPVIQAQYRNISTDYTLRIVSHEKPTVQLNLFAEKTPFIRLYRCMGSSSNESVLYQEPSRISPDVIMDRVLGSEPLSSGSNSYRGLAAGPQQE